MRFFSVETCPCAGLTTSATLHDLRSDSPVCLAAFPMTTLQSPAKRGFWVDGWVRLINQTPAITQMGDL